MRPAMNIYESILWREDRDEILTQLPELGKLAHKSVLITGCTGLICSAVVDLLIRWNERSKDQIIIIVAGRNVARIQRRFAPYLKEPWFKIVSYDSTSISNHFIYSCDYIIHGASNASPDLIIREPVETMISNFCGLKELLYYAKESSVNRILYVSSSEIYGKKENNQPFQVSEYGYIDLLNPRNSYSIGKRAAETLCASYSAEFGVDSVIVRPGHIYGPTALENDKRVSSQWVYAVARGENIVMKSDGSQLRSYCYCLDCASAILKVLLSGRKVHAYNISNPESVITIKEMAELIVEAAGVQLTFELPTDEEKKSFNPMINSSLDSTDLLSLGWKGLFDAKRGFSHTITILKDKIGCR